METEKNPEKIKKMFDEIAEDYDRVNNFISLFTHYIIKYLALKNLLIKPRSMILDVCCGTGDFTKLVNKFYPRAKIMGVDFSVNMLKLAKRKNPTGVFVQADCTNLPFRDKEFDYITAGFGLRNIENRQKAVSEIYRLLKDNGTFMHLDFGYHNKIGKIFEFIVIVISRMFKNNMSHYQYLIKSRNTFPEPEELITEFEEQHFKLQKRVDYLFGIISMQIMQKTS